jgi:DNA mismatch repair protein MutL
VSPAATHVGQARGIIAYVGRRFVRDRLLLRAISDAYRTLLPQGRYPVAVVFVDVPAGMVDVNVHPTKTEVRFAIPDAVYGATVRGVRAALASQATTAAYTSASPPEPGPRSVSAAAVGAGGLSSPTQSATIGRVAEALSRYAHRAEAVEAREPPRFAWDRSAAVERSEDPVPSPAELLPRFSGLRILGQALTGYIVCVSRDALVLIDQHAAHERVRFERLRARPRAQAAGQQLLVPRVVELGGVARACLLESREELAAAGFDLEAFGDGAVVLRAIPAALDVSMDAESLLARVGAELGELGASGRLPEARDVLLARIACHGAVRVGDPLEPPEMEQLLRDLDAIPFAQSCPHGRPVMIEIKRSEIERRVGRT